MWFWVQPATVANGNFDWSRDQIYIAIILLGLGGACLMVLSLSMISILIGEYSVGPVYTSVTMHAPPTLISIAAISIPRNAHKFNNESLSSFYI